MPPLSRQALPSLTMDQLLEHIEDLLAPFAAPETESADEKRIRCSEGIDRLPDIYIWFNEIHSYYDWLTDRTAALYGMKDPRYKEARQRRDAAERAASGAKMRWQGCSRAITIWMNEDEERRMPRGRG